MLSLMYLGAFIFFGESFNLITAEKWATVTDADGNSIRVATDRLTLDTICFHVFVLLNLFNQINCRVLDTHDHAEMNVFKSLCRFTGCPPRPAHAIFWLVLLGEFFIQ
jgi:hypothetical protein